MAKGPKKNGQQQNDLAAKASPFLTRIERLEDEKDSEKGGYMERCRALNDDIKSVYGEAKDAGLTVKALKGIIKRRRLEKKISAIDDDYDIDEQAQYVALAEAFAGTPFGEHAKAKAEQAAKADDDDKDLRPRNLRQPGASASNPVHDERADEAHLAKIGRGHSDPSTSAQDPIDQLAH